MTEKAKGGRGKKAKNPYERFTVTLPPDLRVWLDGEAQRQGVTRSEALAALLTESRARTQELSPVQAGQAKETSMSGKNLPTSAKPVSPPARPSQTSQTARPVAPRVQARFSELFKEPGTEKQPAQESPKKRVRVAPEPAPQKSSKTPQHSQPKTSAETTGDRITGSKLTTAQTLLCAALQMPNAVAEYDHHEHKWLAGFAGAPARFDDLQELTRLGILTVTGEGKAAVYQLAQPLKPSQQKPKKVSPVRR